jgi:hypothetical protein
VVRQAFAESLVKYRDPWQCTVFEMLFFVSGRFANIWVAHAVKQRLVFIALDAWIIP